MNIIVRSAGPLKDLGNILPLAVKAGREKHTSIESPGVGVAIATTYTSAFSFTLESKASNILPIKKKKNSSAVQ